MARRSVDIGTLSHLNPIPTGTRIGPLVVSSIIAPFDPGTRHLPNTIEEQIENLFGHAEAILREAGASLGDVAKMTFYVNDIATRDAINEPWAKRFPDPASRPSRHTLVLPGGGAPVSCDFLAYVES